jgi:hypothetical protein
MTTATLARTYSVTPRTLCVREEDGTKHVMLFDSPKDKDGNLGFLKGGSFVLDGKWVRTFEHPQEWCDCG